MNYRAFLSATFQTVGLFMVGIIPVFGQIFALFTPVPLILAYVRENRQEGFFALSMASLIVAALGGWTAAAMLFFSFGLMAMGTAEGMRRNLKPEQASLLGGLLPVAALLTIVAFYVLKVGKNPIIEIDLYLRETLAASVKTYTDLGLTEMAAMASSIPDSFIHYLTRLMPGIIVATSVTQAACCYGIARAVILKKQGDAAGQTSLAAWHAPDSWVWGLIAALTFIVIPHETARLTGWNLAIIFGVVYLAQGIAIVDHYLRRSRFKPFARGLFIAFILAMPSIVFAIALGIVDIWADFRKVREPITPIEPGAQ